MKILKLHDKGPEVKILQEALVRAGLVVHVSGKFGYETYNAVHTFQLAKYILPTGNAGPITMKGLGMEPASEKHPARLVEPETVSSPKQLAHEIGECLCSPAMVETAAKTSPPMPMLHMPAHMTTSEKGKDFLVKIEQPKREFYLPPGDSGVTIGAGFDLKERTAHEVEHLFKELLPSNEHSKLASIVKAIGLSATEADAWVKKNKSLIHLDDIQIRKLLDHEVKVKERRVKKDLCTAMYQHEFDALVSFSYNSGGKWHKVSELINHGKVRDAMVVIGSAVISNGVMAGLLERRKKEIGLYLYGKYKD